MESYHEHGRNPPRHEHYPAKRPGSLDGSESGAGSQIGGSGFGSGGSSGTVIHGGYEEESGSSGGYGEVSGTSNGFGGSGGSGGSDGSVIDESGSFISGGGEESVISGGSNAESSGYEGGSGSSVGSGGSDGSVIEESGDEYGSSGSSGGEESGISGGSNNEENISGSGQGPPIPCSSDEDCSPPYRCSEGTQYHGIMACIVVDVNEMDNIVTGSAAEENINIASESESAFETTCYAFFNETLRKAATTIYRYDQDYQCKAAYTGEMYNIVRPLLEWASSNGWIPKPRRN